MHKVYISTAFAHFALSAFFNYLLLVLYSISPECMLLSISKSTMADWIDLIIFIFLIFLNALDLLFITVACALAVSGTKQFYDPDFTETNPGITALQHPGRP